MKLDHVLLTTDLSEEARRAYAPVAELARENGARLTLLHVVVDVRVAPHGAPLAPPLTGPDVGDQLEAARAALAVERELIDPDLDVELVAVAGGDVPEAIAEHAARSGADLIALSTHGRAGFRRLILGSVAEAVLHHAHVPVLCFPRPA
jgi:nucleotide-binding universal stress UspA family protein